MSSLDQKAVKIFREEVADLTRILRELNMYADLSGIIKDLEMGEYKGGRSLFQEKNITSDLEFLSHVKNLRSQIWSKLNEDNIEQIENLILHEEEQEAEKGPNEKTSSSIVKLTRRNGSITPEVKN
jgi:hypothetical protein|tara:strand:+ start:1132 stop:1509 length:378 start_codon:yes stop_codon:yes gene_type:complete